jgi:hypothetical protein
MAHVLAAVLLVLSATACREVAPSGGHPTE